MQTEPGSLTNNQQPTGIRAEQIVDIINTADRIVLKCDTDAVNQLFLTFLSLQPPHSRQDSVASEPEVFLSPDQATFMQHLPFLYRRADDRAHASQQPSFCAAHKTRR